jgi:hypothetical protein
MPNTHSQSRRVTHFLIRMSLVTLLLGSCSRAQQLGMGETPQEILDHKLRNPEAVLTPDQSIILLNHCAELGEQHATPAAEKTVSIFAGNTGAGKSTTLNALLGCQMKAETDQFGEQRIVVDPESPRKEVMPIGHHGRQSQTFLPTIVPTPDEPNNAYCDCPGFADTRGAEINIANAINIKKILQQATGIKAVFLTEYSDLIGSRGNNMRAMESMCHQMFGSADNLRKYQNSVLLGITKAPRYNKTSGQPFSINNIRLRLNESNSDIATILANRIFLFDPLDRATDNLDFWHREQLRTVISQLRHIPQQQAKNLFQTTLTDGDKVHLLNTVRQLRPKLANAVTQGDEASLRNCWLLLQRLRVIQHNEVEKIIQEDVLPTLKNEVFKRIDSFKNYANTHDFDLAKNQLDLLTRLQDAIPDAPLELDLNALRSHLEGCRKKYTEQKRLEASREEARRALEAMERQRIINLWEQREAERRALEKAEKQRINNLRELERLERERRAWEQRQEDSCSIL